MGDNFSEYFASVSAWNFPLFLGDTGVFLAVFFLLVFGELGIPFPFVLSSILVFLGYNISRDAIEMIPLILVLIVGRQIGSGMLYMLSRRMGEPFIGWLSKLIPAIVRHRDWLTKKLNEREWQAVFIGRFTPGLLIPTSLVAGMVRLRYVHFALGIFLSGLVWDAAVIGSGIFAGYTLRPFEEIIPAPTIAISISLFVGIVFGARMLVKKVLAKKGTFATRWFV